MIDSQAALCNRIRYNLATARRYDKLSVTQPRMREYYSQCALRCREVAAEARKELNRG